MIQVRRIVFGQLLLVGLLGSSHPVEVGLFTKV